MARNLRQEIEQGFGCLDLISVQTFTANPPQVLPFGSSTLRWQVTHGSAPNLPCESMYLSISGITVDWTGELVVQPIGTTTYILLSHNQNTAWPIGHVTVSVDTNGCFIVSILENEIKDILTPTINDLVNNFDETIYKIRVRLTQRSPAIIEVESHGIDIRLRLRVKINNLPDPDLNIDAIARIGLISGNVSAAVPSITARLDWPWWFSVPELFDGSLESWVERDVRERLLQRLQESIDAQVRTIFQGFPNHRIFGVETQRDQISFTVCPQP